MSQKFSRDRGISCVHICFSMTQTPCIQQVITRLSEAYTLRCSWRQYFPRSRALDLVTPKQQYLPSYLVICSFHLIYSFAAAILFTRMLLPSYLLACSRHLTYSNVAAILFNFSTLGFSAVFPYMWNACPSVHPYNITTRWRPKILHEN